MTYDHDVLMDLPIHLFYSMQIWIVGIQRDVKHLREAMKEWGFDSRSPLKSDSFTIPKLMQFEADLEHIHEEMSNIEKERKVKEMTELKPKDAPIDCDEGRICPKCGRVMILCEDEKTYNQIWECDGCGHKEVD